MAKMNTNFLNLKESYLFIEISRRIQAFTQDNPNVQLIRMGIGDVTLPLVPAVVKAGKKAFDEMGVKETFRGYEDSGKGYDFLRKAIAGHYKTFGVGTFPSADEIFVTDGAKPDSGNIGDVFADDSVVAVTDPTYPVYVDSSIMGGKRVIYTSANESNGFSAMPDSLKETPNIIFLCSPNNPTGTAYTFEQLKTWVDYANTHKAVIVYDAAYEAFITEKDKPRSIYQIEGARSCAIEICSLSKTAGFTGTRCGYTVVPKALMLDSPDGQVPLYKLWSRRQSSKFNGVSYPVQRAAEAVFSTKGQKQIGEAIDYYRKNAQLITQTLSELGVEFTGGINSPYVWFKCPNALDSWDFFDVMLNRANVVGTPGAGFGENGKNRFRLTAFNTHENTQEAMTRVKGLF